MNNWRKIDQIWCAWPSKPKALIEMVGGSYIAATPHLSYSKLLGRLLKENFAIHAWSYVPGFDHQAQANQAWKALRKCRIKLESRIGCNNLEPIRIGHSLGCKLHLLAPDGGRKSHSFIGLCFNNYKADKSIPMLGKIKQKLKIQSEFSPSPKETMNLITKNYMQKRNLLIKFNSDNIDQSELLLEHLKARGDDESQLIKCNGNHLTPMNTGIKSILLNQINANSHENNNLEQLIALISKYASQ
ncbi:MULTISPECIES: DUF1350 family protein [Prochlorococcus]|uniref:Alpha/beta superfamily hydrolase n=1 Tax=Prochlorococcus marinus (strain SARG / CCMP1375 / SS120) TaxID=167539 RepID=Q7VCG4_PROMA|nr:MULTISPECIES: DUF1350 family protein [Prochlorococcus]AAP99820.1 Alpha/beta superfamily hydrolase [Prochlorococcus marinus subsp. marinus str. CCMP1375]KGG11835.1 Alpha/beta hydrolase [Prochlorococcus marinus str. LG]KGG21858.1 Alpha/beta hydrolase [Prochlorococcus marinus str. SS2]KGG23711.1 Alpha/beta hydrolase [Prochlorococcus marinus str. SS35]KGG32053.1 Alpha/beta hydrolase [Prochlorococcus marinus str. SS51]